MGAANSLQAEIEAIPEVGNQVKVHVYGHHI